VSLIVIAPSDTATPTPTPAATPTATFTEQPTLTPTPTITPTDTARPAASPTPTISSDDIDATVVAILEATAAVQTPTAAALPTETPTLTPSATITQPPTLTPPPTAIPPTRTRPGPSTVIGIDDGSGDIIPGTGSTITSGFSPIPGVDALPETLYYLSDAGAVAQVWRLQVGLPYPEQLTFSPTGVRAFDVAPDGALAYITPEGEMVIDGLPFVPPANPDGTIPGATALAWSPDGSQLAYTLHTPGVDEAAAGEHPVDGVWLRSTSGGTTARLQTNVYAADTTLRFFTGPLEWRPGGGELLVAGTFATGPAYSRITLATSALQIVSQTVTHDPAEPVTAHWSANGDAIIAAGGREIWRIDSGTSQTGILLAASAGFSPRLAQQFADRSVMFVNVADSGAAQLYTLPANSAIPAAYTGNLTTAGTLDFLRATAGTLIVVDPADAPLGTAYWFDTSGVQHDLTPLTGPVGSPQWGSLFKAGDRARVNVESDPLNVRATPGGDWITSLTRGTLVTVLDGPRALDGYRWWYIQTADGVAGWSVDAVTDDDGSRLNTLVPVPK
jgi:hypothetical protein